MECPFCHGSNSDESQFCCTCGRRITAGKEILSSEQNPAESHSLGKLRSPLLSGGYTEKDLDELEEAGAGFPKPRQTERWSPSLLRHSNPSLPPISTPSPLGTPQNVDKINRLRSPLLESAAQPKSFEIPEITPRKEEYEALRSPLLSAPISLTPNPPTVPMSSSAQTTAPTIAPTPSASPTMPASVVSPASTPTPAPVISPAATPATTPAVKNRPGTSSMLQRQYTTGDNSDNQLFGDFASTRSYAMLALLTFAAVLKIWFINQYWGQQIIVIDQIAQLLVIGCVALLCLTPGSTKPRQ